MNYEQLYKQMINSIESEIESALYMYKHYDRCWNISYNTSYLETRNKWLYRLSALTHLYHFIYFQMPNSLRDKLVDQVLMKEALELVVAK